MSSLSNSIFVYLLSWIYVGVALAVYYTVAYARDKYGAREHIYYRLVQFLLIIIIVLVIIALLQFTEFKFLDIFTSLLAFIPTGWGFNFDCASIATLFAEHYDLGNCCFCRSHVWYNVWSDCDDPCGSVVMVAWVPIYTNKDFI